MAVSMEWVSKVANGTSLRLFVGQPQTMDDAKIPAVIVLQEAFGVSSHIRDVVGRIAGLGYLAVAPELFHRTAQGFECAYDEKQKAMAHIGAMTSEDLAEDLKATHGWLRTNPKADIGKVAAIGFGMGAGVAWLANGLLPLRSAVSYYGSGISPGLLSHAPRQNGPVLFFWGGKDIHSKPEESRQITDSLRQAEKTFVNVEFSDADQGFFWEERKSYHARAARQSWSLLTRFLRENMDRPT